MAAYQSRPILEEKASVYDHLHQSLEEGDKRIELMEAQALESEVLHDDLLIEVDKTRKLLRLLALS